MKIILVITDPKKRNQVFVTDKLEILSLEEAIKLAREGKIDDAHVVKRSTGTYIRTNKRVQKSHELESLSVNADDFVNFMHGRSSAKSTPLITNYLKLYLAALPDHEPFIELNDDTRYLKVKVLTKAVEDKLKAHRDLIFEAAKQFDIDPYLLGAILIDEIAQSEPFEAISDKVSGRMLGLNTSGDIAQVMVDTAHRLIKAGYYNPNPDDPKLKFKRLNFATRSYLYNYVSQPRHSIFFAAAKIQQLTDEWQKFVDLKKRPEIIATLYSRSYKAPNSTPEPNVRGLQIMGQFYELAKEFLNHP